MRAHQRPHRRSHNAADKGYRFVELPLARSVSALPRLLDLSSLRWQPSQWKWHRGTYFHVLRAGERAAGPAGALLTGVGHDSPTLQRTPELRAWLDTAFVESPPLAWIGASPTGSVIRAHVDNTAHWDEHHRVHVPIQTSQAARLCVEGRFAHLHAGSAWALNNSRVHGAINDGPLRIHLIVDLPDSAAVRRWIAEGCPVEGAEDPSALRRLERDPLCDLTPAERRNVGLVERMRHQ